METRGPASEEPDGPRPIAGGAVRGAARRGDEATVLAALSEEFRGALTADLEYIVLMSPEGRTCVHTNKLREAVVPIRRGGAHYAVLRVGQIVPKGSVRRRTTSSLAATAVAAA